IRFPESFARFSTGPKEPGNQRHDCADQKASHDGEIEATVLAFDLDVPRQVPQTDSESLRQHYSGAGDDEEEPEGNEQPSHVASAYTQGGDAGGAAGRDCGGASFEKTNPFTGGVSCKRLIRVGSALAFAM